MVSSETEPQRAEDTAQVSDEGAGLHDCIVVGGGMARIRCRLAASRSGCFGPRSGVSGRWPGEVREKRRLLAQRRCSYVWRARVNRWWTGRRDRPRDTPHSRRHAGHLLGRQALSWWAAELYPLRLPLALRARADMVRVGLKIRRAAARYESLSHRRPDDKPGDVRARLLGFLDDRTFAELIGAVHPEIDALFRTTAHRMTAEPEEVAAGCMAALFAHVWSSGDAVLGRNMRGGSAELPRALARALGPKVQLKLRWRKSPAKMAARE